MNAKHTAEKLWGDLVSGYRLNEFVCAVCAALICVWCMCAHQHLSECVIVLCFFKEEISADVEHTLTRWLTAGGAWCNSLSEANSMLTSHWCRILVLAHSPVGQCQSRPISRTHSGSVNSSQKGILHFFPLPFPSFPLGGFWTKEVHKEWERAAH